MIHKSPLPDQNLSFISRRHQIPGKQKSGSSSGAPFGSMISLPLVSLQRNELGEEFVPTLAVRQGLAPVTNRAVEPLGKRLLFLILLVLVLFLSEAFSIGSWWRACLITRAASHCLPPVLVPSIASTLPALGFPGGSAGKESACNAGDLGLIPELGRSPGEEKGYPLQYSDLENSMDSTVHEVTESQTRLSNFHFHFSNISPDRTQTQVLRLQAWSYFEKRLAR